MKLRCIVVLLCSFFFTRCHGDYTCLCNYNVEIPVYSGADWSTQVIGYMYEFDCKNLLSDSNKVWSSIEFEHKMGYVESNGQVKVQMCPGDVPEEDRIKSTSLPTSTVFTTAMLSSLAPKNTSSTVMTSLLPATSILTSMTPPIVASTSKPNSLSPSLPPLSNISPNPATASSSSLVTNSNNYSSTLSQLNSFPSSSIPISNISSNSATARSSSLITNSNDYSSTLSQLNSFPPSSIPISNISSNLATASSTSLVTNSKVNSSISTITDLSKQTYSIQASVVSKTTSASTSYTLLTTRYLSTKRLTKVPTNNPLGGNSSMHSNIQYSTTLPQTSKTIISTNSSAGILQSSRLTETFSTNPNPSSNISSNLPLTASTISSSSTNELRSSTHRDSETIHSSVSVAMVNSTVSPESRGTYSMPTSRSSSAPSGEPHTTTIPFTNNPVSRNFTTDFAMNFTTSSASSETFSYHSNSFNSASFSTRLPPTTHLSTSNQTITKNHTTENVTVTDRVDLCPYKNLALSKYNSTTFTYPLFRQYGNYCYELRLKLGNWFEAQHDCVSRGGELVVIQNEEVQIRVYNLTSSLRYKTDVWIGLHDLNQEGHWEWVNGETMTKSSFSNGILINPAFTDSQDCVVMEWKSGVWKNTACKTILLNIESYPWICQYKMM